MAINPFAGIDFSGYQKWPSIVSAIDGKRYYEVPGHPGTYFDPLRGRNGTVTRTPEQQIEQKKKADQALNPTPGAGSQIAQTLTPIVGTAGGIVLANQLANIGTTTAATTGAGAAGAGAGVGAGVAAPVGVGAANTAGQGAGILGITGTTAPTTAAYPVGTAANGGALMSDGTIVAGSQPGMFSLSGIGSAGNVILPAAGVVGAYDMFANKRRGAGGVLQGAASGAAMGSYFGAPGAIVGGVVGLGAGLLQAKKSTKEVQEGRWKDTGRADLADKMKGWDYGTNNAQFMQTRDEKFLTPDDIRVNPDNYNNVPDWDKWTKQQQDAFLNDLLRNGKVREKKGGIYYDDGYAKDLADRIRSGQYGKPQTTSPKQTRSTRSVPVSEPNQPPVAQPSPQPQPTTNLPTNTVPYGQQGMRNYYDPNLGMVVGGQQVTPQEANQARQNLMGNQLPQNAGILSAPMAPNMQVGATPPPQGGLMPLQTMPYQQPQQMPNVGILNTQVAPQGLNPQQPMNPYPIIQQPVVQQPVVQQPAVQPQTTPQPQKKITGKPTVAQNTKPTKEEIIAELNKPGGLAGLFNGRRDLPKGIYP